jgi:hypothetical protein
MGNLEELAADVGKMCSCIASSVEASDGIGDGGRLSGIGRTRRGSREETSAM